MSSTSLLHIPSPEGGAPLTPAQKRFNTLNRQIAQARETLAAWHEAVDAYRVAHAKAMLPLQADMLEAQRQWALALDAAVARPGWSKQELGTLRKLACAAAAELLDERDDDREMQALFARHAGVDHATARRAAALRMKEMAAAMTGLDLGDDAGIRSHDDVVERVQQGLRQQSAEEEAGIHARAARRARSAAQRRRASGQQPATQSVRDVFRKLASALHPDRETDAQARVAKTAMMQRANHAYAANDLMALLELQVQVEQIDASHFSGADVARLTHYNQVLADQLDAIRTEIDETAARWRMEFGLDAARGTDPGRLGQVLEQSRRQLLADLAGMQQDLRVLEDAGLARRWLKRQRQLLRDAAGGFPSF